MLDSVFKNLPIKECFCYGHYSVTDTTSNFKVILLQNNNSTEILIFFTEKFHNRVSKLGKQALCGTLQCKDVGLLKTAPRTLQILVALKECKKKIQFGYITYV